MSFAGANLDIKLPVEILQIILEDSALISPNTAYTLMFVSSEVKAWVERVLYSKPIILLSSNQAYAFITAASSNSATVRRNAQLVTSVWLMCNPPPDYAALTIRLSVFPNLAHLACYSDWLKGEGSPGLSTIEGGDSIKILSIIASSSQSRWSVRLPIDVRQLRKLQLLDMTFPHSDWLASLDISTLEYLSYELINKTVDDSLTWFMANRPIRAAILRMPQHARFCFKFDEYRVKDIEERRAQIFAFLGVNKDVRVDVKSTRRRASNYSRRLFDDWREKYIEAIWEVARDWNAEDLANH